MIKFKPSSYINYLDTNNLYGLTIYKKLPYQRKFRGRNFRVTDF